MEEVNCDRQAKYRWPQSYWNSTPGWFKLHIYQGRRSQVPQNKLKVPPNYHARQPMLWNVFFSPNWSHYISSKLFCKLATARQLITPDWEKWQRLSGRPTPLRIMGTSWGSPLKPSIPHYRDVKGLSQEPKLGPMMPRTSVSRTSDCCSFQPDILNGKKKINKRTCLSRTFLRGKIIQKCRHLFIDIHSTKHHYA